MIGAVMITLAILVAAYVLYMVGTSASAQPSEVVYVTEERWDPWHWWPAGPWRPHWDPHPFHPPHRPHGPLGPGGERHMLGPGGERRLMGGARRG
jgi:hypothetical protein